MHPMTWACLSEHKLGGLRCQPALAHVWPTLVAPGRTLEQPGPQGSHTVGWVLWVKPLPGLGGNQVMLDKRDKWELRGGQLQGLCHLLGPTLYTPVPKIQVTGLEQDSPAKGLSSICGAPH